VAARLGEILLRHEALGQDQLDGALVHQSNSGGRLGEVLIAQGVLSYLALYRALAEQQSLPFVNLLTDPPDEFLLKEDMIEHYLRLQILPWRRAAGGRLLVALCNDSAALREWAFAQYGDVDFLMTSPLDIRRAVETRFTGELEAHSRNYLWQKLPFASARATFMPSQVALINVFIIGLAAAMMLAPQLSLLVLFGACHIIYALTMVFKAIIFMVGAGFAKIVKDWSRELAMLDDASLPIYTVLVPMYREPESLAGMLKAMQAMEYPIEKLDIKLVLEADDEQTIATAIALKPSYQFEIIRVPPGKPRTKPRACNYALHFARGEFVTVFDADDRPEPLQLKKAVYAFRTLPANVACLQARLNYYNAQDNLLTRFFALEYHALFNVLLPGLQYLGIPLPLGGTSNHIALSRIRELGEWDPYNVTEDADLGVRLSAQGFRTAMIDSYTMEESPNTLVAWLRQRSRWIKGYMQTWLVHMRAPAKLYRTLGLRGFLGFQFFVGLSTFAFLTAPLLWAAVLMWGMGFNWFEDFAYPDWLLWLTGFNLVFNILTNWIFSLYSAGAYPYNPLGMRIAALLYPLYLLLHSLASYKALWQLIFRPHFWEKTMHGRARSFVAPPIG